MCAVKKMCSNAGLPLIGKSTEPSPTMGNRTWTIIEKTGAGDWNRTSDLRFTKPLLYQLSYAGILEEIEGRSRRLATDQILENAMIPATGGTVNDGARVGIASLTLVPRSHLRWLRSLRSWICGMLCIFRRRDRLGVIPLR